MNLKTTPNEHNIFISFEQNANQEYDLYDEIEGLLMYCNDIFIS